MSSGVLAPATEIAELAVNTVGLAFICVQVVLARRQIQQAQKDSQNENRRLKRQSTVDFYMTTVDQRSKWKSILPDEWDEEKIHEFIDSAYQKRDPDKLRCIADYLGYFEALAVAIGAGIYDLEVLHSIAGARIIHLARNYKPYFTQMRDSTGVEDLYAELEWLADKLEEINGVMPKYITFANRDSTVRELSEKASRLEYTSPVLRWHRSSMTNPVLLLLAVARYLRMGAAFCRRTRFDNRRRLTLARDHRQ